MVSKNKIFIEFDDLDKILIIVKKQAKEIYENDGEKKILIDNIFLEIDKLLVVYEQNYKIDKALDNYFKGLKIVP